jgi:hypothetical protein
MVAGKMPFSATMGASVFLDESQLMAITRYPALGWEYADPIKRTRLRLIFNLVD